MEPKEIAQAAFEAMVRGNWEALDAQLDPEVEWRNPPYAVEPGTRRGRDEFRRAVSAVGGAVGAAFELSRVEADEYVAVGDRVVVVFWLRGTGSGSGVPINRRFGGVYTFRGGKVASFAWFNEPDEAFAAAQQAPASELGT
jgi:ketosteroid isomerase-like protein